MEVAKPPAEPAHWERRRMVGGRPVDTLDVMVAEMRRLAPDFAPPTIDWGPDVV